MKKILIFLVTLFYVVMGHAGDTVDSTARAEVVAFIKRLYSTPINDIEGEKKFKGKFNPDEGCKILNSFFVSQLVYRAEPASSCDLSGDSVWFFRFPSLSSENIGDLSADRRVPRYKIDSVFINNDRAIAKVLIPSGSVEFDNWRGGRTVYFLVRTPQGWRISNILAYNEWPLNLKGEYSDCRESSIHYGFALPPKSPEDFEDLPPACRERELDDRRRNGWGR